MMVRYGFAFLAIVVMFSAGCGGGASAGSTAPSTSDFAFGELSGRAAVSNPPVSASTQTVIATAFTGTFSTLKIRELNPGLQETRIVASSDFFSPSLGLVSYAIDGSDPQRITNPPTDDRDYNESVAANGKIVFQRVNSFNVPSVNMVNIDGTGFTQMSSTGFYPSIDTAGDKFVFTPDGHALTVMNTSTKATTNIPLPANDGVWEDAISLDGSTVYVVLLQSGTLSLYNVPADGSGGSTLTSQFAGTDAFGTMAVSPDNSELAIIDESNPPKLLRVGTHSAASSSPILFSSAANGVSYSADGKSVVVGQAPPGESIGLYVGSLGSVNFTRITQDTDDTAYPAWTPFVKDRTLIASGGGLLGTRACGVILAQHSTGATSSVVAFDVTTPSSVVMTAQPTNPGSTANIVFSVDADNITKLAYANTTNWRGIRAIGSSTPVLAANGALVSVSGVDGTVVSVLPFTGTRSAGSRPVVTDNGTTRTFSGSFLAVYDKDGKNLAPNGASVVTLDTKSGALTVKS